MGQRRTTLAQLKFNVFIREANPGAQKYQSAVRLALGKLNLKVSSSKPFNVNALGRILYPHDIPYTKKQAAQFVWQVHRNSCSTKSVAYTVEVLCYLCIARKQKQKCMTCPKVIFGIQHAVQRLAIQCFIFPSSTLGRPRWINYSGRSSKLRGTGFKSRSARMFVIEVCIIQCTKLSKGLECAVLSMALCT